MGHREWHVYTSSVFVALGLRQGLWYTFGVIAVLRVFGVLGIVGLHVCRVWANGRGSHVVSAVFLEFLASEWGWNR